MKWIYPAALAGILQCVPLLSKEPGEITSMEDKVKRLEQDSGIDTQPERTTINFFGEFLYWKASLDGVAYATTGVGRIGTSGALIFDKFKTRTAHFEYDPGFQIGVGIGLPHDHWDMEGRWLRFHTRGYDEARGDLSAGVGNKVIFDSIGTIEGLDSPPSQAKAECHLKLDVVDAVLGRTFLWSRYFWFHPFAGIRAAWVRLDWDIAFKMPIVIPSLKDQSLSELDVDNRYTAVGFVGGFDSKWNLWKGIGLFSHASASLIYGKSSESTEQEFTRIPPLHLDGLQQTLTAHNSAHAIKGVFDIAVGLKWESDFYKKHHFMMWAGYDFFYWPNVTQKTINQFTRSRDRADMSFEGLIMGARVDY
ncbi:MAG: hypothetical protein JSS60_09620 [Verrucomicrobia bacterium]|nr:hypothetical protein [Verrucomicrobiota bacterium]